MSLHLQGRVASLEAEVKALREVIDGLISAINSDVPVAQAVEAIEEKTDHVVTQLAGEKNPNGPRTMCPHCGEKPNYYLHTKWCKGKQRAAPI